MKDAEYIHVAVGVIKDNQGNILIALRHKTAHQGGLWEFPGGKVETGETVKQALTRELQEELDILVKGMAPLIKIRHQYADKSVLLDVWAVTDFSGVPKGCEGQLIKWITTDTLQDYSFPEANYPIITAAKLPSEYAILNFEKGVDLLKNLNTILDSGVTLIQARIKTLNAKLVSQFLKQALPLCRQKGAYLLINSAVDHVRQTNVNGIHLTSKDLLALKQRPAEYQWVAASCHNQKELKHAEKIEVDFVVLAPVLATTTHPDVSPIGWKKFEQLTNETHLPVFALGGLKKKDKKTAQQAGAQGISGISMFLM